MQILDPDIQSLYQEVLDKAQQQFSSSLQPYSTFIVQINEYDSLTIISSIFHSFFKTVENTDFSQINDFIFAVLFFSIQSMLTLTFDIRSTRSFFLL